MSIISETHAEATGSDITRIRQRFLALVLPEDKGGRHFYYSVDRGNGNWRDFPVTSTGDLITAIDAADAGGGNVYYCMAAFGQASGRKGEFATHRKCLALDLDVGKDDPKKSYPTREEAREALEDLIQHLGMGQPLIVSSGQGLHAYWTFDEEVDIDDWKAAADQLKRVTKAHGIRVDDKVTTDKARVLRLPGCAWRDLKGRGLDDATVAVEGWGDGPQPFEQVVVRLSNLAAPTAEGKNRRDVDTSINDTLGSRQGPVDIEELKDALAALPVERVTGGYNEWLVETLMCIHESVTDDEAALDICDAFSRGEYHGLEEPPEGYPGREAIAAKLLSFTRGKPDARTVGSIYAAAQELGWRPGVKAALDYFADARGKQKADAGFAFLPESLDRLIALDKNDPAGFARVFDELTKAGVGKRELKKQMGRRRQETAPKCDNEHSIDGYELRQNGIYRQFMENARRLANFDARIVEEIHVDDGVEQQHYYRIEGTLLPSGIPLDPLTVSATDFLRGVEWTSQWGAQAIVETGSKDDLRVAIQKFSQDSVTTRHQYGHTGWREIDGRLHFLFNGGAITARGLATDIEVSLAGSLKHYNLPDPNVDDDQMRIAISRSLRLMDLAPNNPLVGALLVSAAYTAPLGHWVDLDCSVHSFGQSGVFKTEASGLLMQHYGVGFNGRVLPASWNYSLARLMGEASRAKDVPMVIDDYKPQSSEQGMRQMAEKANRVFTNVGNRLPEGRAKQDGSARPDRVPMCLPYSSGEIVPEGESCRARLMLSKVDRGEIDPEKLTKAQGYGTNGDFALAMAGYVKWLAANGNGNRAKAIRARLREELRADPTVGGAHARSPDNAALLLTGLTMAIDFATEMGVVDQEKREALLGSAKKRLLSGSVEQAHLVAERNEAIHFMRVLREGLDSNRMYLAEPSIASGSRHDDAVMVGWQEGDNIYLTAEGFAETRRLARELGDPIHAVDSTLKRRLYEKGFLLVPKSARDKGEWTSRKALGGHKQRGVFHLVGDREAQDHQVDQAA